MTEYLYSIHDGDDFNESIARHIITKTTSKQIILCGHDWAWLFDEYNMHGQFVRPKQFEDLVWFAHGRYDNGGGFYTRRIAISSFKDGHAYHHPSRKGYYTESAAREIFNREYAPLAAKAQR